MYVFIRQAVSGGVEMDSVQKKKNEGTGFNFCGLVCAHYMLFNTEKLQTYLNKKIPTASNQITHVTQPISLMA